MFRTIIVLFLVLTFVPVLGASADTPDEINGRRFENAKANIKSIDVATLHSWIEDKKNFILLDVREPDEIDAMRIVSENSIAIPRGVVDFLFHRMVPDIETTVVVYCSHGNRSAVVTELIDGYGYKNIYNLKDGIYEWVSAGYRVENFYGTFEMKNFEPKL